MDMRQINYSEKIQESAQELYTLERKSSAGIVRDRLRFLRLLKEGTAATPPAAGAFVSYKKAWSYQLWKRYEAKGLSALSRYPFKGTSPRLDKEQQQQFVAALAKDNISSLSDAAALLKEQTGISYTIGGMCYVMKRLGIKKKTGRPCHIQKDQVATEAFKKKHRS
jgi:transposase